jgi:threonine dehydrogenase-like Zn-dependent dehydrogenase
VVVVGRRESRLEVARQLGATLTILASDPRLVDTVKESTAGGVDIAFEASGDPSMVMTAAQCCRPGGLASVYGLSDRSVEVRWDLLPPDVSIRAPSTNEGAMYPLVAQELLSAPNRTWEYVSHVSSLSDFEAAVARCDAGQSLKTIITFDTD